MSAYKVLAFSSSRVGTSGYLAANAPVINDFLGGERFTIAFIPFADASNEYEAYAQKVRAGLNSLGAEIVTVEDNASGKTISTADAIMIGGGNTFKLLHHLYQYDLMELIKAKVKAGTPYIGWSAGANITGLTIGTTNDMPIIEPESFSALAFLPFQLNPHYLNVPVVGHNGETRDERLLEYLAVNPSASIIGLPEGSYLKRVGDRLQYFGDLAGMVFRAAQTGQPVRTPVTNGEDLSWLL